MNAEPRPLIDRLFPPRLTPEQLHDYERHHLPYVRGPLLALAPTGVFAALTLYALNPQVHGRTLEHLAQPLPLALLLLLAGSWGWMLLAPQVRDFSRACLAFLLSIYLLVAWLAGGRLDLLLWLIPQFLVWQLAIAPLALRPRSFLASLAVTALVPSLLLAQAGASGSIWAVFGLHLLGLGGVAMILFRAGNRIRREGFLATQRMRRDAFSDSLTGMLTRRRFFELAERSLDYARQRGWPVSVCFLDLDDFKQLNDQRGHAFGDRVLTAAAHCLLGLREVVNEQTQERPAARHVLPGRMGGEEFALLLVGYRRAQAREVAESLLASLRALRIDDARITASAGVAQSQPGETLGGLLHRADLALLQAKRDGKDRVMEADADIAGGAGRARHVRPD